MTLMNPVLMYGCEACEMNKGDEKNNRCLSE